MLSARIALGLLALSTLSCNGVQIPALPPIDVGAVGLPVTEAGKSILIEVDNSRLEMDPTMRDPITAVAACADLVAACYQSGDHSLDDCIAAVPTCHTNRPWEESAPCCPEQCRDDYQQVRHGGASPRAAYDRIYLTPPTCFPGVLAAIGGAP